jgi:hypothetical protein
MSDDEDVQLMEDGPEGGCMDEEAQLFGAAQAFDAVTGMPVPRAGSAATSASSSSNERRAAELADIAAQVTAKPEPVWNLTLAQKNESNTGDIKVPHMLGIDEAGRGPVLGQCDKHSRPVHSTVLSGLQRLLAQCAYAHGLLPFLLLLSLHLSSAVSPPTFFPSSRFDGVRHLLVPHLEARRSEGIARGGLKDLDARAAHRALPRHPGMPVAGV